MQLSSVFRQLVLLAVLAGCTAQAQEKRTLLPSDPELAAASVNSHGQWQSAPWSGSEWILLGPAGIVTVPHPLGRVPTLVLPYLSFEKDDSHAKAARRAFLGAGDVANLYDIDDKNITVENRTQAEFYLRLVVE